MKDEETFLQLMFILYYSSRTELYLSFYSSQGKTW